MIRWCGILMICKLMLSTVFATAHEQAIELYQIPMAGAVAISPDSQSLVISNDNEVVLYNFQTGEKLQTLYTHSSLYDDTYQQWIKWSPNGRHVAFSTQPNYLVILETHNWSQRLYLEGIDFPFYSRNSAPEWSPNGRYLAYVDYQNILFAWDTHFSTSLLIQPRQEVEGNILALDWSPDNRYIAYSFWQSFVDSQPAKPYDFDEGFRIWDMERHQEAYRLEMDTPIHLDWSPTDQLIALSQHTNQGSQKSPEQFAARLWDYASGQKPISLVGNINGIDQLLWSEDGHYLLSVSAEGIYIWDVHKHQLVAHLCDETEKCTYLPFAPLALSHHWLALQVNASEVMIMIWDIRTGAVVTGWEARNNGITHLLWSPDGSQLVSAGYEGTTRVWQVR